jgi:hypothetical protein
MAALRERIEGRDLAGLRPSLAPSQAEGQVKTLPSLRRRRHRPSAAARHQQ